MDNNKNIENRSVCSNSSTLSSNSTQPETSTKHPQVSDNSKSSRTQLVDCQISAAENTNGQSKNSSDFKQPQSLNSNTKSSTSAPQKDMSNQHRMIKNNGAPNLGGANQRNFQISSQLPKRGSETEAASSCYFSEKDDDGDPNDSGGRKRPKLDEHRRLFRNEKEKERTHKIGMKFVELQNLLTEAGIPIPKGTKACVLETTMNYIQMLHQHKQQLEQ